MFLTYESEDQVCNSYDTSFNVFGINVRNPLRFNEQNHNRSGTFLAPNYDAMQLDNAILDHAIKIDQAIDDDEEDEEVNEKTPTVEKTYESSMLRA